ncbi:MAG: hypothetical protein M1837_004999 [Sclerophora amabilis]|nr:MAG: hypothetical protein M1837_004999 [Sclerophora amabilis]
MEVDRYAFQSLLPALLESIANAHFIAFDLELSGIASHSSRQSSSAKGPAGKQSLQQRYSETKQAAEKYQVLQVGFTCVEQDAERGVYIARPYNFNLSPLIRERLGIERDVTFQGGAVEFLLEHRFRLEVPFTEGVPYLSRQEEVLARKNAQKRQDRSTIADIDLREDDIQGREFVQSVRTAVKTWKSRTGRNPDFLNIGSTNLVGEPQDDRGLNNFQKRLVHQIIKAEHPDLVSFSRPSFIQIVEYDEGREESLKQGKMKRLEEQLSRQIGLRWLIEAMIGGDISRIDERSFARDRASEPVFVDMAEIRKQFTALQERLAAQRTVLVGHNMFTDLVNLYHTFLGALPEKVVDFQDRLHQLFPMIIDTKWLFTFHSEQGTLGSSLQEIDEGLQKQETPSIETHIAHQRYLMKDMSHEAGYDSFLTAKILIKLASNINAEGTVALPISDSEGESPRGGVLLRPPFSQTTDRKARYALDPSLESHSRVPNQEASLCTDETLDPTKRTALRPNRASKAKKATRKTKNTKFGSAGMFDSLTDLPTDEEEVDWSTHQMHPIAVEQNSASKKSKMKSAKVSNTAEEDWSSKEAQHDSGRALSPLIPPFDDIFWQFFGNKLRVFGTQEGICDLN